MIRESQQQESQSALLEGEKEVRAWDPFVDRIRLASDANRRGRAETRSKQFHRQAVGRLYQALVNRAILDVLECGENSPAAEKWLISRDFDRLQELFN